MSSAAPPTETLKVLYHLHPDFDTLDFAGPYEILSNVHFPAYDSLSPKLVFESTITAIHEETTSNQLCTIKSHISIAEAHSTLAEYDILIIPGGGTRGVLDGKTEPLDLIKAFASLPQRDGRIRTILSVCTGSLLLAEAGVLNGLSATTHPHYYEELKEISEKRGKTEVLKVRFVVNKVDEEQGLRVITSGGVSCGLDSCLWLVEDVAGEDARARRADNVQYAWRGTEGVVI